MSGILPEGKLKASRVNPKMILLYSLPKVGKTEELTRLDNCLILDFEGGAELYDCARVPINSCNDIDAVIKAIGEKGLERKTAGKTGVDLYPYKYIAIDTADVLEDYVELKETIEFNNAVKDKADRVKSVCDLAYGAGYGMVRRSVTDYIDRLSKVCQYLIIIAHVKEKLLSKGGVEVTSRDISLSGKLGQIVCAKMDAIGYMSRNQGINDGKMMINFQTFDNSVMGARCAHLAGQQFPFSWEKIYIEEKI
jgi:hypothetical protein